MEKLIITAAICGAEVTKAQNEAVPYTVEEMVREAKSAYEAGAAILHIHVREDDGTPTQNRDRFKVVMDAIRKELPDVIMIPSTGGATGMSPEERLQPTELFPEMATLDCGTCNFGDEIFDNTMPTMRAFGKRMIENGIKPEYECFELGHIDTVLGMAKKGEVPPWRIWRSSPARSPLTPPGPCPAWAVLRGPWPLRPSPWAATSVSALRTTSIWARARRPRPTASWWPRSSASPRSWAARSLPPPRPARS